MRLKIRIHIALWASLLACACSFSVDPSLTKSPDNPGMDGGLGSSGGGAQTNAGNGVDANGGVDEAGASGGSTGQHTGGDSGSGTSSTTGGTGGATSGGTTGPTGTNGCKADEDCAADQLCFADTNSTNKECVARCTADGTCFGTEHGEREVFFAADGANVCYTVSAVKDPDGLGALQSAAVYAWNIKSAPVRIAGGLARADAKLVVDGQCYFVTDSGLARVPMDGSSAPQDFDSNNTSIVGVWSTPLHVWWSTIDGSGANPELFRTARTKDASAERLPSATLAFKTGNSARLFRLNRGLNVASHRVESAPTTEPENVTLFRTAADPIFADETALYVRASVDQNSTAIERVDLNASAAPTRVSGDVQSPIIEGDWMVWYAVQYGTSQYFNRYFRVPTRGQAVAEEILRFPVSGPSWLPMSFAVVKNYVVHTLKSRVVAIPIAPAACGDALGCSFGTTCSAQKKCQ